MKLLLATLHARYVHASLALPCLATACAGLDGLETVIGEFTVNEPADRVLRQLAACEADVVAFSCYIWNIEATLKLAADLKLVRPETVIVLGGPEASYGAFMLLERNPAIDCIVRGEGEETFRELMALLAGCGRAIEPWRHFSHGGAGHGPADIPGLILRAGDELIATPERPPIADLDNIPSPFAAGLADLAKPLVYFETSRGCPFSCAFCMSSLEQGVRSFSPDRVRDDLRILISRKVQTVKLVDRTFNYDAARAGEIWEFILAENRESRFHFEIAADLLTEENFRLLRRVPAGLFRFEIGVQSGEEETLARVTRRSDLERLFANVRRLVAETGVVVHLDLVAGLPGEDFPGFLRSLQRLFDVLGQAGSASQTRGHIQVEPLKVLKGSPMRKIAAAENYAFSAAPPYKVLRTPWLSFTEICRIEAVSRLLDLVYNSGKFSTSLALIAQTIPLSRFLATAAAYWEEADLPPHLSQTALFEALWRFADGFLPAKDNEQFRDALCFDFCRADYPVAGKLPGFFGEGGNLAESRKGKDEIATVMLRLDIAAGSRVRTFSRRFALDYRSTPWQEGPVELLFVYVAAPGKGLEVIVMKDER
jgi:anaerobic magnesium-protoporphyrin IX monomethyl ester cyclase